MVSINRLTENLFLLTTGILSLCAWVIAFGGLCAFRQLSNGGYWLIVYELFLILGILFVFMSGTFLHYRMVLLTFLAVSIAMLMGQVDAVLPVSKFDGYSANQGGAAAYAAGYIIIVIIQYLWVFVFGSEPHSYLGQFGHGWSAMNNSVDNHHQHPGMKSVAAAPATAAAMGAGQVQSTHQQPQYEMTTDKTMVPAGGFNSPQSAYEMQAHPAASSPQQPQPLQSPSSPQQEQPAEYKERVEALHDYSASTDDPSELSFRKGEILEVVERKGNWWQARKADGTMGIIPSNYFA